MRTGLIFVMAWGLSVGSADAVCRQDQKLSIVGTVQSTKAVLATGTHEVRLVLVSCGSSACVAGLFDTTTVGATSNSNMKMETAVPANTTLSVPSSGYFEPPLAFTSGVVLGTDANVQAVGVYECIAR